MAEREQSGTNIDPGVISRIVAGVRYVVSGVRPGTDFFGPGQPLPPAAQEQAEGRAWDFPVALNTRIRPRDGEAISFAQLRALADGYDLMRLVIETRKDQIESFDWEILPRTREGDAKAMKGQISAVTEFLQRPNREHNWVQWLRQVVEELLVIDTICVYPRMARGGKLYGLELVDGGTIKRVLDATGRTPAPPDPAYQQILKGIPAADYSADDLVYMMRNPRVWKLYGYSPVEQVITTVNIALRRQMTQMAFYTEGNVPEALAQAPESWTAKQIADFQLWWDSIMEGNLAQKRRMRFIPSLKDIVFPREAVLKDEYDEWLARIICFAFSISPSALIKQVNRASGEQMADSAKEEGLMPLLRFIEAFVSNLVQRYMGAPDLRFAFKIVNRVAPGEQAEVHSKYIAAQVMTPDEVREDLGRDAMTPEQREAAFPAAPEPEPGVAGQGRPPAGAVDPSSTDAAVPKANEEPSAAEKMLADAIRMLDPSRVAEAIEKATKAQPPQVVEVRPEVNVEVGDTNVHMPAGPPRQAEPLAKAAPPRLHAVRTMRMADGTARTVFEEKD